MGFLSKLWKGIKKGAKKIWKGVKKIGKKIVSGVKKVWDKFRKSGIGKAIMVAAAVYFGGVALGAWGGAAPAGTAVSSTLGAAAPITSSGVAGVGLAAPAGGSLLGAAGAMPAIGSSAVGAGAAGAGAGMGGTFAGLGAGTAGAGTGLVAGAGGSSILSTTMPSVATSTAGQTGWGAAGNVVGKEVAKQAPTSLWGSVKDYGSSALDWASKNPELTIAGGQALSAMTQDDPYDTWRKQREWERANSNVAGINGNGSGQAIGMGLVRQSQQNDLYTPTYQAGA